MYVGRVLIFKFMFKVYQLLNQSQALRVGINRFKSSYQHCFFLHRKQNRGLCTFLKSVKFQLGHIFFLERHFSKFLAKKSKILAELKIYWFNNEIFVLWKGIVLMQELECLILGWKHLYLVLKSFRCVLDKFWIIATLEKFK